MKNSGSLSEALATNHCTIDDSLIALLERYCQHLWTWNEQLNLTRHTDYDAFVTRDLLDCQQLAPFVSSHETVLDAGSGGGVPGIVLALLNPSVTISLAESTRKKAVALEAIVRELGIPVSVFAERAESVLENHPFDTITARAVAPLKKLIPWFQPQRHQLQRMLLIKGPSWQAERDAAEDAGILQDVDIRLLKDYATPGRDGHSVILEVCFR